MIRRLNDPHPLQNELRHFIANPQFPCVGAKSAMARGVVARAMTSAWDDLAVHRALMSFVASYRRDTALFQSFAVIFETPRTLDERQFERQLWHRLQSLSDKDKWLGQPHNRTVSHDPANPHFGMSFAGEAFFVVGLHPHASRKARRFRAPTMVFNLRAQFDQLRAEGRYEKMRATILDRDVRFSGSINPMLARHGESSEARQYSGRVVGDDWRCPFHYGADRDAA
jgi:uncharacterized protein